MKIKNILYLILFVIPVVWTGIIFAVATHEILGHGLGSLLVGHQFTGFELMLDGMGAAYLDYNGDPTVFEENFIYLAGASSTFIFAIIFFILAFISRKKLFASLTFLIFGMTQLMDGAPYMLWNSIYPIGNGDFAKILELSPQYANLFIGLGLGLMIFGIIFFNIFVYRTLFNLLGDFYSKRYYVLLIIFLFQAGAWFSFDWRQLIPDVGLMPQITALTITFIVLLIIGMKKKTNIILNNDIKWFKPIIVSWSYTAPIFLATYFWFQHAVFF